MLNFSKPIFLSVFLLSILLLSSFGRPSSAAPVDAGNVSDISGNASAVLPGSNKRNLDEHGPVYSGDTIQTEEDTKVSLKLLDDTTFFIGSNSEVILDEFVYDPNTNLGTVAASMLKGTFRYISGTVAKINPQAVTLRTPLATIGIRGTVVLVQIEPEESIIGLLPPEQSNSPGAIQVSNQFGTVDISTPGFATRIQPGAPPSAPFQLQQQTIRNLMDSLRAIQTRPNIPRIRRP